MSISCRRHIDYSERKRNIKTGIVHALPQKSRETACGHYLSTFSDYKLVDNTTSITCKSCLKVLGANDNDIVINNGNLFAIRADVGLFLDNNDNLTANITKARLFKVKENAESAIEETVLVHKKNKSEVLTWDEYNKLSYKYYHAQRAKLREEYSTERRPKKGFKVVPVTLSFNEDSSYNEECPKE